MILSRSLAAGPRRPGGARRGTTGSATASSPSDDGYVVATTSIWADLTQQVLCDGSLAVRTLIPAGTDAHSYEPSFQDRETLDGATLIVANGHDLEELLDDTLDQVDDDGTPVFAAADHDDTSDDDDDDDDDDGDHDDGGHDDDPHVWLDPVRVAGILPALGDALVAVGADRDVTDRVRRDRGGGLDHARRRGRPPSSRWCRPPTGSW